MNISQLFALFIIKYSQHTSKNDLVSCMTTGVPQAKNRLVPSKIFDRVKQSKYYLKSLRIRLNVKISLLFYFRKMMIMRQQKE